MTAHPRELLNSLLDGELTEDEHATVQEWLEADPAGREELDALARVRSMVRGLPAVEPPPAFFERLLAGSEDGEQNTNEARSRRHMPRHRRRRRVAVSSVAAVVAIAAAMFLFLGFTPLTDQIVPPVEAFAERHNSMMSAPDPSSSPPDGYEPMRAEELETMRAPYMAPGELAGYRRSAGYQSAEVVHLVYSNGTETLSVYEQRGAMDWSRPPSQGHRQSVRDADAWEVPNGSGTVMVIDLDGMVVSIVSTTADAAEMMELAETVPAAPAPSVMDRASHNWSRLLRSITG